MIKNIPQKSNCRSRKSFQKILQQDLTLIRFFFNRADFIALTKTSSNPFLVKAEHSR